MSSQTSSPSFQNKQYYFIFLSKIALKSRIISSCELAVSLQPQSPSFKIPLS